MAIDYTKKIHYISNDNPIVSFTYLKELPDTCPICLNAISPEYILLYDKDRNISELLCGCPRHECGCLFISEYKGDRDYFELVRYYPNSRVIKDFPKEVTELSPDFVKIYNQAIHDEQEGLDLICGVGFRKALEYLIKDFTINTNPVEKATIQNMSLQRCVQTFINEPTIKEMAERAIWIGNDETHYIRKWEDKDIKDLKNLIDLTVYFISMNIKAIRYKNESIFLWLEINYDIHPIFIL
ncbi:hypothetical protein COD66_29675 [Bacillus cereus]|nr:hypothetical protein COD66_29675 [Bacillus cereus]